MSYAAYGVQVVHPCRGLTCFNIFAMSWLCRSTLSLGGWHHFFTHKIICVNIIIKWNTKTVSFAILCMSLAFIFIYSRCKYGAWSKRIRPHFFLWNREAFGAGSGALVTLDLRSHAWIFAFRWECSVAGSQKNLCTCVACVALTMTKKGEHRICIKCCQKLGQLCSETYDMIQKAFGNEAVGLHKLWSGLGGSKRDRRLSRAISVQGGPAKTGTNWWLTKCGLTCSITGKQQSESSLMSWGFHLVQYSPFWQKIWAWNTSQHNLSQNCWQSSRKRLALQ